MPSRSLDDLSPGFRAQAVLFESAAQAQGLDVLICCTHRTFAEQARLYRQGRRLEKIQDKADELTERWKRPDLATILMDVGAQYGSNILTNAAPGESLHNYGLAFDVVPMREGKPVWSDANDDDKALWEKMGNLAPNLNMEWGGLWMFTDKPHFQQKNISWKNLIDGAT